MFYSSHTLLAALNIKRKIHAIMGKGYIWYRLIYSLFSTLFILALFLYAGTIEPYWLLSPSDWMTYFGFMLATFGTIISVKSMKHLSFFRFLGLKPYNDLDQKEPLTFKGIFQYIRHPLYAGLILMFLGYFFYIPTLSSLIHLLALLAYLPFGIYYEEKKLIEIYGEEYLEYRSKVPPLIPRFIK